MAIVFFIIAVIALIAVGIGLAIAAVIAGCGALLISMGIVSSSMLVGFKTGSASKGVRLAGFQICAALGSVSGLGIAAGIKCFTNIMLGWIPVEVLGLVSGLSTGFVVGASFSTLLKYILQRWGPRSD